MNNFLKNMVNVVGERKPVPMVSISRDSVKLDFCNIFKNKDQPVIISEIKFSSPSLGRIYEGELSHIDIAYEYLKNGASALSVLTEPVFFDGDVKYIKDIRDSFSSSYILMKDFIINKEQILQAAHFGANAILLMVSFLEKDRLMSLYEYALELGLTPIIEVHDEVELKTALKLKPKIIGINNRNLKTMEIDLEISRSLIKHIPENVYVVCESGLSDLVQINEMQKLGFDGFLIGTHFMKNKNPGESLKNILKVS